MATPEAYNAQCIEDQGRDPRNTPEDLAPKLEPDDWRQRLVIVKQGTERNPEGA